MDKNNIILSEEIRNLFNNREEIYCYDYDTIDSTNKKAWELLDNGINTPFVVTTKTQTDGKGQRGNQWQSMEGGLYLSLILNLNLSIEQINQITLFSIWGVVNQLRNLAIPVQIKWLNDLILDNCKLGGILCEVRTQKTIIKQAIIGVGINYQNQHPPSAISLEEWQSKNQFYGVKSLRQLKEDIILGILSGYQQFLNQRIERIIEDYNLWLKSINCSVLLDNNIQGKILGINEKGFLKIELLSLGAKTITYLSPQDYQISYYQKDDQYFASPRVKV